MGARDFIVKPIDAIEVLMRTRNLLEARWLQQHLCYELERSGFENLERLAHIAESRDSNDYEHATRVGALARRRAYFCKDFRRRFVQARDVEGSATANPRIS